MNIKSFFYSTRPGEFFMIAQAIAVFAFGINALVYVEYSATQEIPWYYPNPLLFIFLGGIIGAVICGFIRMGLPDGENTPCSP